jgi:hypothetical protein
VGGLGAFGFEPQIWWKNPSLQEMTQVIPEAS